MLRFGVHHAKPRIAKAPGQQHTAGETGSPLGPAPVLLFPGSGGMLLVLPELGQQSG